MPKEAAIKKLAGGFQFTEGPFWRPQVQVLWFSDVVGNVVSQWSRISRLEGLYRIKLAVVGERVPYE